jgi:hypothetical protein
MSHMNSLHVVHALLLLFLKQAKDLTLSLIKEIFRSSKLLGQTLGL